MIKISQPLLLLAVALSFFASVSHAKVQLKINQSPSDLLLKLRSTGIQYECAAIGTDFKGDLYRVDMTVFSSGDVHKAKQSLLSSIQAVVDRGVVTATIRGSVRGEPARDHNVYISDFDCEKVNQ